MLRVSLRTILAHKLRLALTALTVIAGVAFVSGTMILTDSINATFTSLFTNGFRGVTVQVRGTVSPGGTSERGFGGRYEIPASALSAIRGVPGVASAAGEVQGMATILDASGKPIGGMGPPTLGFAWVDDPQVAVIHLSQGHPPRGANDVVIDPISADRAHASMGSTVAIAIDGGAVHHFTVAGIISLGAGTPLGGATIAAFDLKTAQTLFGKTGVYDVIAVSGTAGTDPGALRDRIATVLPVNVEAITGATATQEALAQVHRFVGILGDALFIFAAIALFVSAFIIVNTFTILIAQRTRELALLRALGASRAQVVAQILTEALITGLIAGGAGLLAGRGFAALLVTLITKTSGGALPTGSLDINLHTVVAAFAIGTGVTVAAALVPARRATRIPPVAALRESLPELSAPSTRRLLAGTFGVVVAVVVLYAALFVKAGNHLNEMGAGAALFFISLTVTGPAIYGRLGRRIAYPAARLSGVAGRLARENVLRNPRRTSSTASALVIGVALVTCVSVLASSFKQSLTDQFTGGIRAELVVTENSPQGFNRDPFNAMRRDPALTDVMQFDFGSARVNGTNRPVDAVDPALAPALLHYDVTAGDAGNFSPTTVLVDDNIAASTGVHPGSQVPVTFADGATVTFTVAGVFTRNPFTNNYVIPQSVYERHTPQARGDVLLANAASGHSLADAKTALDNDLREFPTLSAYTQDEYIRKQSQRIDGVLILVTVLLLLAVFIALLGIVNTLALAVTERSKEIGLLRALGLERVHAWAMVTWEAVTVSVMGALVGVVVGLVFGWAFVRALADQGLGSFAVSCGSLIVYVVIAAVAGVMAAFFPALRASRLDILSAIAAE